MEQGLPEMLAQYSAVNLHTGPTYQEGPNSWGLTLLHFKAYLVASTDRDLS
jgi:hypothetical protein